MSLDVDFVEVLKKVSQWPPEQRATLAHALIDSLKPLKREKPTIDQLVGIGRGAGPAPTDEQVKQWIDEHRTQKYGK
jgi:hypothetical protein